MAEGSEVGEKQPIRLTKVHRNWLDHRVADRRTEIFESLQPGQEMPFVNRGFIIREMIDAEIEKGKAA